MSKVEERSTCIGLAKTKARKRVKFKASTLARRAIVKAQRATHTLIPKAAIDRLVREILQTTSNEPTRLEPDAVKAIHEASEAYLIEVMAAAAAQAARDKNRVTISKDDFTTAHQIVTGKGQWAS